MFKTEEKTLKVVKFKVAHNCVVCREQIPSGSYGLGSGYYRVCLKCIPQFLTNMLNSFNGYKVKCEELLKTFAENEQKFVKNNILAKVEN